MSFVSTQNLNASYNTLTATTTNSTNVTAEFLTIDTPIVSTNTKNPPISSLGYLSVTNNDADVVLTTDTATTVMTTADTNPIGVYSVFVKVPISVGAGATLTNTIVRFQTAAGVIQAVTQTIEYAAGVLTTVTFSGAFFNSFAQNFAVNITATFAGGAVTIIASNAELRIVRIA